MALDTVYASVGRKPELVRFLIETAISGTGEAVPAEGADIVWATNAPEFYLLLVGQRGWSPERYEHFLADAWHRLLLA